MGNDLLFTRASAGVADSVTAKDTICVAELGAGFRAASTYNVASLYRTEMNAFSSVFTVSNYTSFMITITTSSGASFLSNSVGPTSGPVACVRIAASLQFTRALAAVSDPVATKDGLCVAEFGSTYRAAAILDVAASYRAVMGTSFGSTGGFTVSNYTANLLAVTTASGNPFIGNFIGPTTGAVACVSIE